jgi:hypothetical protein
MRGKDNGESTKGRKVPKSKNEKQNEETQNLED